MTKQLKPCPFCEAKAKIVDGYGETGCWVQCSVCDATGPIRLSHSQAIQAWNTRPEVEKEELDVEKMHKFIAEKVFEYMKPDLDEKGADVVAIFLSEPICSKFAPKKVELPSEQTIEDYLVCCSAWKKEDEAKWKVTARLIWERITRNPKDTLRGVDNG